MKKSKIIILSVLILILAVSAGFALSGLIEDFELQVHKFINPNASSNIIFKFFTDIGEATGVIGITAVFMLLPVTRRRVGAPLSVTVMSSWLLSTAIKNIIRKPRPVERLLEIGGFSFPSGHAMNNSALYIGLMIYLLRICKNRTQKIIVSVICIVIPLMIGISRIYFNVHYLSDVISGWCLGGIVAIITSELYFKYENKIMKKDKK